MEFRNVVVSDYQTIIPIINDWWGGRQMDHMLLKLFFVHFKDTSFIVEENKQIIGFLIGFVSQTNINESYIHFVGVHPDYRKKGIGKALYIKFFETVNTKGCNIVRCVTSPINKTSIIYHTKMGFEIEEGNENIDGVSIFKDYDGKDKHRVLFKKRLNFY